LWLLLCVVLIANVAYVIIGGRLWFFRFGLYEIFDGCIFSGSVSLSVVVVVSLVVLSGGVGVVVDGVGHHASRRGRCWYCVGLCVGMCGLLPVLCVVVLFVASVSVFTAAAAAVVLGLVVVVCSCCGGWL